MTATLGDFLQGNLQELTGQLTDLAEQLERTGPQHKDMVRAALIQLADSFLGLLGANGPQLNSRQTSIIAAHAHRERSSARS